MIATDDDLWSLKYEKSKYYKNILSVHLHYRDYNDYRNKHLHKYHGLTYCVCVCVCMDMYNYIELNPHIYTVLFFIYKYILTSLYI